MVLVDTRCYLPDQSQHNFYINAGDGFLCHQPIKFIFHGKLQAYIGRFGCPCTSQMLHIFLCRYWLYVIRWSTLIFLICFTIRQFEPLLFMYKFFFIPDLHSFLIVLVSRILFQLKTISVSNFILVMLCSFYPAWWLHWFS